MRKLIVFLALFSVMALAEAPATGQFLLRIEPLRTGFTLQNMTPEEARLAGQHVQYLKSILDSGKLSLAAQVFDPNAFWGMVIVNAPDRETARALLDADPMVKGKMFRGEVLPLRVVFEKPGPKASSAVSAELEGDWEGTITARERAARVVVHFRNELEKTVKATLDSPDQNTVGLALTDVLQKDSTVEFQLRAVNGSYKGALNKEGNLLTGEWSQGGFAAPLTLKKAVAK